MEDLLLVLNWNTAILFAIVILVIRPIGVFLCTWNSDLKLNEKLFISWVGPRGIVAAGIASLFGLKLASEGYEGAEYITPLVFTIVLGTVLLNATTARLFAKLAGVFLTKSEGILIVGASNFSRLIGVYLLNNDRNIVMIDNNQANINKCTKLGLEAINTDIYSDSLVNNVELSDIGFLMALTGNDDINNYVVKKFSKQFGENGSFRLVSEEEKNNSNNNPEIGLFSHTDDYITLTETARNFPDIYEISLNDKLHYHDLIQITNNDPDCIPIFLKDSNGELEIISSYNTDNDQIGEDWKLVILGKNISKNKLTSNS
jgi:NhaP-type Na+/H+ and K+/H+ antiporter